MHGRPTILVAITATPDPSDGVAVATVLRQRAQRAPLWLTVDGPSMGRGIASGTRVRVTTTSRPPRRGEVWAFCLADATVVVHRCRRPYGRDAYFQGDARTTGEMVEERFLIGRVDAVDAADAVGRLGRIARWRARLELDLAAVRRRVDARRHRHR